MIKNKMKIQKRLINIIILIILSLLLITNTSYSRYYDRVESIYVSEKAEPVVRVEKVSDKLINHDYTKNSANLEYTFLIMNYSIDESGSKKISEVSFDYEIKIIESNNKFPVKYYLYDLDDGTELLNGDLISVKKHILKNIDYTKTYKLVACWDGEKEIAGNENDISIEVNILQSRKGALS